MSNSEEEKSDDLGIDDEQLPDDLVPGEDNPLAEGLDDGETVDDLLDGGKTPEDDPDYQTDGNPGDDSDDNSGDDSDKDSGES